MGLSLTYSGFFNWSFMPCYCCYSCYLLTRSKDDWFLELVTDPAKKIWKSRFPWS